MRRPGCTGVVVALPGGSRFLPAVNLRGRRRRGGALLIPLGFCSPLWGKNAEWPELGFGRGQPGVACSGFPVAQRVPTARLWSLLWRPRGTLRPHNSPLRTVVWRMNQPLTLSFIEAYQVTETSEDPRSNFQTLRAQHPLEGRECLHRSSCQFGTRLGSSQNGGRLMFSRY